jgi:hypothetical protein
LRHGKNERHIETGVRKTEKNGSEVAGLDSEGLRGHTSFIHYIKSNKRKSNKRITLLKTIIKFIDMKRLTKQIHMIFTVAAGLLLCVSCVQEHSTLIHTVSDLSVRLSCVASQGNDTVWTGDENGRLICYNYRTDDRQVVKTNFFNSRIYDIVREADTLWLGVRNHGLVKYIISKDSVEKAGYEIGRLGNSDRKNNYAPYDLEMDREDGTLYLATSSGAYRLKKNERKGNMLTLIYRPDSIKDVHFGVNQIKIRENDIYCATDLGLAVLDKRGEGHRRDTLVLSNKFLHLYYAENDSVLYASSESVRYSIDKSGTPTPADVPKGNLFAYAVDPEGGKWEFYGSRIVYSAGGGQIQFPLPERMDRNYRNSLCTGKDILFFAHGMRLYSFSLRQNPKGKSHSIAAARTHGKSDDLKCYFISGDNYLYSVSLTADSGYSISPLGSAGKLGDGENIIQMTSSDSRLWFITDRENLYGIDLNPPFFRRLNPFIKYRAKRYPMHADLKSIFYSKSGRSLYIGTRKNCIKIVEPEKNAAGNRKILDLEEPNPKNDLYATDILEYKDTVYISSLNHGLLKLVNGAVLKKISDTAVIGEKRLTAFPRGLFLTKETDTLPNLESVYRTFHTGEGNGEQQSVIIGYRGAGGYAGTGSRKMKLFHLDMHFNPAAAAEGIRDKGEAYTVLLGSQTGLYEYRYTEGTLTPPVSIQQKSVSPETVFEILVAVLLALLASAVGAVHVMRNVRKKLEKRKDSISDAIEKNMHAIMKHTRKEDQHSLCIELEEIRNSYKNIHIDGIFKLRNSIAAVKSLENRMAALAGKIRRKHIDRNTVIDEIKQIIKNLKDKFELQGDVPGIDSITKYCEAVNALVEQVYANIKDLGDREAEKKLADVTDAVDKILDRYKTRIEKEHLPQEDGSRFALLEKQIDSLEYLIDRFAERLGFKPPEFPETDIPEELKKEIESIEKAYRKSLNMDDRNVEEKSKLRKILRQRCNEFIGKHLKEFQEFSEFRDAGIKDMQDSDNACIIVLYCIEGIKPKDISNASDVNRSNEYIGRYKGDMINRAFPKIFDEKPKLKSNPLFILLYRNMSVK